MFRRILRRRSAPTRFSAARHHTATRRKPSFDSLEPRLLLAAEIAVLNGAAEIVSDTSVAIDFGNVTQGAAPVLRTFTIRNDGDDVLSLGTLTLPAGYSLVEGLFPRLAERGSDTFTIRLDTAVVGTKAGEISLVNNDDDENPFRFPVTGTVLPGAPEITVLLHDTVIADGAIIPIDFGSVLRGRSGPVQTFTVRNDGTLPLTLGPISLPAGFSISEGLLRTLRPGTADTFSIQLNSAALGTKTGEISFFTNDADESPFNFAILGTVVAKDTPEIAVLDGFTNIVDGSTTAIDFGTTAVGFPPIQKTFTVRNNGTSPLVFGSITVPAGFTLVEGLPETLVPRATESFTVQLDSDSLGVPAGDISVVSNDADENPFSFAVKGTVVAPSPEIRVVREDLVELSDAGLPPTEFATVVQDQIPSTLTLLVHNNGFAPLMLGPVTVPLGYTIIEPLADTLEIGESDTFTVQLDTETTGVKAGDILIASDDADENPFHIPITGTVLAAAPEIAVRHGNDDIADGGAFGAGFGPGVQGLPGPLRTFTVRNVGSLPLTLGTITLPERYSLFEGLPGILAPGGSDSFTVRLESSVVGTFTGEISIVNNDGDENPFDFSVTGTITAAPSPEITLLNGETPIDNGATTPIDFGSVVRRQTGPTRTFTIRNDGNDQLVIGQIELPDGYKLVKKPRRTLAPRGIDTIIVRLDSKRVGVKEGVLRIETNDSDESPFRFAITGTVLA